MSFFQFIPSDDVWCTLQVEYGTHGFIEYHPGNTNLILSIPHGGKWKPPNIKDRSACDLEDVEVDENCETSNRRIVVCADKNTMPIGKEFVREFVKLTGTQPHVIFTNLHRVKLDTNRPVDIGTSKGDSISELAHSEYHQFIRKAAQTIDSPGLLIDLHGQNHKQNSIELGYLLHKSDLNSRQYSKRKTSISNLIKTSGLSIEEILFGESSLGALFEDAGYKAVPSPRQQWPGEHKYYTGGYITQTHGSSNSGLIDSIQIEVPGEIRNDGGDELRLRFSRDMARVIQTFHARFYQKD